MVSAQDAGFGLEIVLPVGVADDLRAVAPLDQHLHGAVRELQELQHGRQRPDLVDRLRRRIVVAGVLLGRQHDLLVGAHHLFERVDRFLAADEERHDHVREDDNVPERQHRIGVLAAGGDADQLRSLGHCLTFSLPRPGPAEGAGEFHWMRARCRVVRFQG